MKILARTHQILGDGKFWITPGSEVSSGVIVPAFLLHDKKKESSQVMFSMLKEALETLGKELSAAYFMSDFEIAIRDAFTGTFQGIEAKGCAFHYSKAVLSKVARSGFKGDFQSSAEFACLVRAIFGLAYVPLPRLAEALRNLYILAQKLDDRQAKFAVVLIRYVERTWVNGSFPPETWNMYQHQGETTNNHSEGYNFRLGNNQKLGKHPNVYRFVSQIKHELSNSLNNAIMANNGNPNIKERPNSKSALAAKVKKTLMAKLEEGTVDILSYQQAVGRSIFKTNRPTTEVEMSNDHLVVIGDKDEEEIVVPDLNDILVPLSIVPQTEDVSLVQEETVQNPDIGCQVGRKRKSQMSYSVVGRDLRKKRRLNKAQNAPAVRRIQVEEITQEITQEDEDITADPSSFGEEIGKEEMFRFYKLPWPRESDKLLSLRQGIPVMKRRLRELDLSVSPTQPETPRDGNCMMHCLHDQLKFDPYQKSFAKTPQQLRQKILSYGYDMFIRTGKLDWQYCPKLGLGSPEEWQERMSQDG